MTILIVLSIIGMSCFARHGKLFEKRVHTEELLKSNGFGTKQLQLLKISVICYLNKS